MLLTVTENGYGKRCEFSEFAAHHRGGKGMRCHNVNEKTGRLACIAAVNEDDDVLLITDEGIVIRTRVSEISVYSRTASGVIVMRTDGKICNFAVVEAEEEAENEPDTEATEVESEAVESESEE